MLSQNASFSPLKPSVLVIDDNKIHLTYLSMLFSDSMNLFSATSAKEGLDVLWGEHNISCVLLELALPDLNGLEVLRKIRNNERTADLDIIIITGSNNNEWILRSVNMNIQGYFKKPFDGEALNSRVLSLCGDSRVLNYRALRKLWCSDYEQRLLSVGVTARAALDYIECNYHKICRRDNVAVHLDISPDYLSRLFKEKCGLSLTEYITLCRVQLSKELLIKHPRMKVKSIALHAGLPDVDYFCKVFKKASGQTPKEFRGNLILID